jgi:hypothetical protein
MKKNRAKHRYWWLAITAILLFAVSAVCGCCPCTELLLSHEFNSQKWKTGTALDRGRMSQDLMRNDRLIGLTRPEVWELLGPPDHHFDDNPTLYYRIDIGFRFGFTPWLYVLHVRFDSAGRVAHVGATD